MTLWTQSDVEFVAELLHGGFTASQIAARFSREHRYVSRSAVIGIVARNRHLKEIGFRSKRASARPAFAPVPAQSPAPTASTAKKRISAPVPCPGPKSARSSAPTSSPEQTTAPDASPENGTVSSPADSRNVHFVALPFLKAAAEQRCLFPLDLHADDAGPEMPVCGQPLDWAGPIDNRYCTHCRGRAEATRGKAA